MLNNARNCKLHATTKRMNMGNAASAQHYLIPSAFNLQVPILNMHHKRCRFLGTY